MKKTGLIFFILLLRCAFLAQTDPVDSLKNILKTAKTDTSRLIILVKLTEVCEVEEIESYASPAIKIINGFLEQKQPGADLKQKYSNYLSIVLNNVAFMHKQQGNNAKALENWEKCLSIQQQLNDKKGIALSFNNIAAVYSGKGEALKAIEYLNKSIKISEDLKDKPGIALSLNNIAFLYFNQGDVLRALEYYSKSMDIYLKMNDKNGLATTYNNIGTVYENQKDKARALDFFRRSLKLREDINDKTGIAYSLNNIGAIYKNMDSIKLALDHYTRSLKIRETVNDKAGIAESKYNLGSLFQSMDSIPLALKYYNQSIQLYEEMGDKPGISMVLNSIGNMYLKTGKLNQAILCSSRALKMATELGYPQQIKNSALLLYEIENKLKHWKNATEHYELYIKMRDSLANEEISKATIRQQIQYDYENQKALDKTNHDKEMAVSAEKAQKQKILSGTIAVGLLFVLFFALFIFSRLRISNKQKQIIEEQKELVEVKNHVIKEKQKEIIDSINYAKRIQYTLLAHEDLLRENLPEYFVHFNPKDIVSGDFYWATKKDNRFYLAVCDSTGHGVPGAFMSLLNISFLNEAINEKNIREPHLILNHVRNRLIENISKDGGQDGMDAILICIEKNNSLQKPKITYAAANNSPLIIKNNSVVFLDADKMPVGKGEKNESFTLRNLSIDNNDIIYLYTDGFADQFGGPKGKKFKYRQLNELLLSNNLKPMKEQEACLTSAFNNWRGKLEQIDDVCVIGFRV